MKLEAILSAAQRVLADRGPDGMPPHAKADAVALARFTLGLLRHANNITPHGREMESLFVGAAWDIDTCAAEAAESRAAQAQGEG